MNNTNQSSSSSDYSITSIIWLTFPPILLVFGTFGHILTIVVLIQRRNSNNSIARYLIALAVSELIVLWTGCPRHWIKYMFAVDIRHLSEIACKLHLYLICFGSQSSSMLIVVVTLERFIGVWLPLRHKRTCTPSNAVAVITVIAVVNGILNAHLLYGMVSSKDRNCTPIDDAYTYFVLHVFSKILACVSFFIPLTVLFIGNIAIIVRVLMRSRKNRIRIAPHKSSSSTNSKDSQMTAMLVTLNVVFMVCVTPMMLALPYFMKRAVSSDNGGNRVFELIWAIVNMMYYTNSAVNFILYFLSGARFRREVKLLLNIQ